MDYAIRNFVHLTIMPLSISFVYQWKARAWSWMRWRGVLQLTMSFSRLKPMNCLTMLTAEGLLLSYLLDCPYNLSLSHMHVKMAGCSINSSAFSCGNIWGDCLSTRPVIGKAVLISKKRFGFPWYWEHTEQHMFVILYVAIPQSFLNQFVKEENWKS
jgi:hypothetical protein